MTMDYRLTYGVELEWADVDRRTPIPSELGQWDNDDITIVNSNAHANDPTGEYPFGGEINTTPTDTPQGQAEIVDQLRTLLNPTINYRCNLHVHVGIGEAQNVLWRLKQVIAYCWANEDFVYSVIEPIPRPVPQDYPNESAYKGAVKRYKRRLVSHHHTIPVARRQSILDAETIDEFYDRHAHYNVKTGRYAFHLAPRAGMNLRSLRKNGTIEYRHFAGTCEPNEIESAVDWCGRFTLAALTDQKSAAEIYLERPWAFPTFRKYDHTLELGYLRTKYEKGGE